MSIEQQDTSGYWDRIAPLKTFSHPLDTHWIVEHLSQASRILDLGCGYGRVLAELWSCGFRNSIGVDTSPGMIARGKIEHSELDLRVLASEDLPFPEDYFGAVILFAVLTCIPEEKRQLRLMAETERVLRAGGILYLSDYCLQPDARNQERYARDAERFGNYGVFELPDGAVVRHHDPRWIEQLAGGHEVLDTRNVEVLTMNGNSAIGSQWMLRKRPDPCCRR